MKVPTVGRRAALCCATVVFAMLSGCTTRDETPPDASVVDASTGCGNGAVEGIEECDDSNATSGDGCSATCQFEGCGDGRVDVEAGEQCDDGGRAPDDGCSATCRREAECGNGIQEDGEGCDDGNDDPLDGCSPECTLEDRCGNLQLDAGEECDDGNTIAGDRCSPTCMIEPFCGDGTVDSGETCDDRNDDAGDGCSPTCAIEPAECGNGTLEGWVEACDDGNTTSGDGCSDACAIEGTCGAPIDIFATAPTAPGTFVWSGSNDGASDNGSGTCASRLGGRDRVFLLDPPSAGRVTVRAMAEFGGVDAIVHARSACSDLMSQRMCNDDGDPVVLELTPGTPVYLFVDAPVSGGMSRVGNLMVEFVFAAAAGEGEPCDDEDVTRQCAEGLLCAPAPEGGGSTCQRDIDLGCGLNVRVTELVLTDRRATFAGDTNGGSDAIEGECGADARTPEQIYHVVAPFDGVALVRSVAGFDHILFAASACPDPDAELDCADSGSFDLEVTAGDDVFLVAEGWNTGRGTFSGSIEFRRRLELGDPCTAADICPEGSLCGPAAGGGRTCQADLDLGCGANVPVIDVEIDPVTRRATAVGDTNAGLDELSACGGGNEVAFRVTSPVGGLLEIDVEPSGFAWLVAAARTVCTDDATESVCDANGEIGAADSVVVTPGTPWFVIVEENFFGGSFEIEARVVQPIDEGGACGDAVGGVCRPPLVCRVESGSGTCQAPVCGDGRLEGEEECDDGNTMPGDGCSAECALLEVCGDGYTVGDEQCDDMNDVADDGCDECGLVAQRDGADVCTDAPALRLVRYNPEIQVGLAQGDTSSRAADLSAFCGFSVPAPDEAYSLTLTERRQVTLVLTPSGAFDGAIYVQGAGDRMCNDLQGEVECRDTAAEGDPETLVLTLDPGRYFVIVDGNGTTASNRGEYQLAVRVEPPR